MARANGQANNEAEDADSVAGAPSPGLASAAQVRRLGDVLTTHMQEEAVVHTRLEEGVRAIRDGHGDIVRHLEAGATAQMRQAEIAQARLDAEREAREAAKAAREAEEAARAAWWGRASEGFEKVTSNWLVRVVVLALLIAAVPEARGYVDRLMGIAPAAAPAPAAHEVAPAPGEPEP